jgi:hypothetical protein
MPNASSLGGSLGASRREMFLPISCSKSCIIIVSNLSIDMRDLFTSTLILSFTDKPYLSTPLVTLPTFCPLNEHAMSRKTFCRCPSTHHNLL